MISINELKKFTGELSVLYAEDEENIRKEMSLYLRKLFKFVKEAKDGKDGLDFFKKGNFDIVFADIRMPNMDGVEMTKKIKALNPEQEIVILSAYTDAEYLMSSIKLGVSDYIVKPVDYNQINETIYKLAVKLHKFKENELYHKNLEYLVEKRTREKESIARESMENYKKSLVSLVKLIENRDAYTAGHSQRVAKYCVKLAKSMGYNNEICRTIYQSGILHDIGKISIPDAILLKPDRLNNIEYKLIQLHVKTGYDFLSKIPMYRKLAEIMKYHHERYDGKGYPYGLSGDKIPILSHIMIVADAFDAMTTNRIYKRRKTVKEAVEEIKGLSGKQFHPEVAEAAYSVLNNVSIQKDIDQLPKNKLEEERFAYFYKDHLTDTYNKNYLNFYMQQKCRYRVCKCKYLTGFFLHNFTEYNRREGWEKGDEILKQIAIYLKKYFKDSLIFRIYGDVFIILSEDHIKLSKDFLNDVKFIEDGGMELEVNSIYIPDEHATAPIDMINQLLPK